VFACLALGDSLAIGVGHARPDCYVAAITGITSERYVQIFPGMRHVRTAIISLGVNDGEGVATADNLIRLRAQVLADTVYWLLTGGNPRARDAVRAVAGRFGDRLIDAAPLAGTDHVHPDRAGYARLAAETRGGIGSPRVSAYRNFMSPARAYRALPDMKGRNGPSNFDGAAVAGVVRP
jgi:lysophospholipase L1-like esterase